MRWECLECHTVNESNPNERHKLDRCICGETWVDAEEGYTRHSGNVEFYD